MTQSVPLKFWRRIRCCLNANESRDEKARGSCADRHAASAGTLTGGDHGVLLNILEGGSLLGDRIMLGGTAPELSLRHNWSPV